MKAQAVKQQFTERDAMRNIVRDEMKANKVTLDRLNKRFRFITQSIKG